MEGWNGKYILGGEDGHTPILCEDTKEWGKQFEKNRHVGDDTIDLVRISTVFLGLDHQWGDGPPLLFETMIFGGPHDQYQMRCSTWDEAIKQHVETVNLVKGLK